MVETQSAEEGLVGGDTSNPTNSSQNKNTSQNNGGGASQSGNTVKPYTIEELTAKGVPQTIPYLEVYRTDEVFYRPYTSPYLAGVSTTGTDNTTDSSSEDTEESSGSSTNDNSTSNGIAPKYSSKNKNTKLKSEIKTIVKNNFKEKANQDTLVKNYMNSKTTKEAIGSVTNHSSVWLKDEVSPSSVNDAIYRIKHKYS